MLEVNDALRVARISRNNLNCFCFRLRLTMALSKAASFLLLSTSDTPLIPLV